MVKVVACWRNFLSAALFFCLGLLSRSYWIVNRVVTAAATKNTTAETTSVERRDTPRSGKPVFVLHVGLHKTGTTFLQSVFCNGANRENYENAKRVLMLDNFVALGTGKADECIPHGLSSFFSDTLGLQGMITKYPQQPQHGGKDLELNPDFKQLVTETRERGHNAMVVFEEFSTYSPQQVQVLADFLTPHWQVEVLVAYRPLYSWLQSVQSQVIAYGKRDTWIKKAAAAAATNGGNGGGGGGTTPSTRRPFDIEDGQRGYASSMFQAVERHGKHPAELVREKFAAAFGAEHVSLLPMQLFPKKWKEGEPLLGHIFCSTLLSINDGDNNDNNNNADANDSNANDSDNANDDAKTRKMLSLTPNICKAVESGDIGLSGFSHSAQNINPYLLAEGAYARDLVPPDSDRLHVIRAVAARYEEQQQAEAAAAQLKCMSDEALERLERVSWQVEDRLFDDYDLSHSSKNNKNISSTTEAALRSWIAREKSDEKKSSSSSSSLSLSSPSSSLLGQKLREVHRAGFQKLVTQNKFCHVDVDRLLDEEGSGWVQFFEKSWNKFAAANEEDEEEEDEEEEADVPTAGRAAAAAKKGLLAAKKKQKKKAKQKTAKKAAKKKKKKTSSFYR